jgi:hypothetical protein
MKFKHPIILLIIIIAILISACTLTTLLQAVPTPSATPAFSPSSTLPLTLTASYTLTPTEVPSLTPTLTPSQTPSITPSPTTPNGSISGVLWHEICRYTGGQAGEPLVLGEGCVQWGAAAGEFGPNQIYDSFESGWPGVTLHIGAGACPSTGFGTAVTNAAGNYKFYVMPPGTYCISYNPLTDGNDSILIPGGATFPQRGSAGLSRTVTLGSGENKTGVNFGYAWQFYN